MKSTTLNYFILILLCLVLYLPGLASLPTIDRDEGHFAQATRQMLETGNFFQIRFQDNTRYQKPPGINWLQALSVSTFSDSQANKIWPYRLPSTLGGFLAVLLTFAFSRRIYGNKVALIAACLLSSTLLFTVEVHMALTDAMLLAATILMQGALWFIYIRFKQTGESNNYLLPLIFWLAMSFGFALKGVTPFIACLTIIALSWIDRDVKWIKSLRPLYGISLFLIISLWLILVNHAEGTNYFAKMLQKDLLPKLVGGHESHGAPPGYHLVLSLITLWPTSVFLWLGFAWGIRRRKAISERFLLACIIPTWLFYELMPTKLPQYILPTYFGIAILSALAIVHSDKLVLKGKHLLASRCFLLIWSFVSLGIAVGLLLIPLLLMGKLLWASVVACTAISLTTGFTLYFLHKQRIHKAMVCIILGAAISYPSVFQFALPQLSDVWLSQKIATAVENTLPGELSSLNPLYAVGYQEPSLVFAIGTNQVKFDNLKGIITRIHSGMGSYTILLNKESIRELKTQLSGLNINIKKITTIQGYHYTKGNRLELVLIELTNSGAL